MEKLRNERVGGGARGLTGIERMTDDWEKIHQPPVCFKLSGKTALIKPGFLPPSPGREGRVPREGREEDRGVEERGGGLAGRKGGTGRIVVTSKSCGSACSDQWSVCS